MWWLRGCVLRFGLLEPCFARFVVYGTAGGGVVIRRHGGFLGLCACEMDGLLGVWELLVRHAHV